MNTPRLVLGPEYLTLELPPESLKRHEIESWIVKVLSSCRHENISRILIWRKDPVRLQINPDEIERLVNIIDSMKFPHLRIALAFPMDYYSEELDRLSLAAKARGIVMELFFDHEIARHWLIEH